MLHGTGGNEREMLGFGKSLLKDVGYLSARGQEPEHGMNRWFRRLEEGVFDIPNLVERAEEFATFVEEKLPTETRIAVGFSNGANMAGAILLLRPEVFHAAALLAPMVPLEVETLPDLSGKEVLIVAGERDPIVPRMNVLSLATMLETAGASVDLQWHPGGHGLSQREQYVTAAWLARVRAKLAG